MLTKQIPEKEFNRVLRAASGGYLGLDVALVDVDLKPVTQLSEARYLVAENYYGYLICEFVDGGIYLWEKEDE